MAGNSDVADYVRKRLPEYFPNVDTSSFKVNEVRFNEKSTYPIMKFDVKSEADSAAVETSVIVKTAPKCKKNTEGLTEFNNMETLRLAFQELPAGGFENRALGYINSLDYSSELNILVSEFVPHNRLSKIIFQDCVYFSSKSSISLLNNYFYSSGKWLQLYHQLKSNKRIHLEESDYYQRINFYIDHINTLAINIPAVNEVTRFLVKYEEKLSKLSLPLGRMHGDYGPQNIGVGGDGKIYVFDLQRNHDECIYHDIAYFLVTLETLNPYPNHVNFNRKLLMKVGKEFLLGYRNDCSNKESWDDLLFHTYYLRCLLERVRKQSLNQKITASGGIVNALLKKYIVHTFNVKIYRELETIKGLLET